MPVSDVLRGFIGETARFADEQRHAQRQREDEEIGNQQAMIRAYMEHPNVNPAMLGQLMEDYVSLGKSKSGPRKGKGGMGGFMGASDTPISHIIQGLHSGEFMPSGDPDQPAGMSHGAPQTGGGGQAPPLGPASGKMGGGAPTGPAPTGSGVPAPPPASGMAGPVAGAPPSLSPELSAATAATPASSAAPVAAAGVPQPPKAQPLLLNSEAMARREELGKSAGAYGTESGKLRAIMDQAQQLKAGGMSDAEIDLWRKKQLGIPLPHYTLTPVVDSKDPTQATRWVNYEHTAGAMTDPDTHQPVTGMIPDPKYHAVSSYDGAGNLVVTYEPAKPGGIAAQPGGVLPQATGAGGEGRVQFQPITPVVTTGPGGTQTTTLVPHAPVAGRRPTSPAAAAPAPAGGNPRTAADVPPPPAAGTGPTVSRSGGMTSVTGTHWDVDQKQIVDSVTQAAPMLARVEKALSTAYGGDAKQYPDDFGTQVHQIGQGLRYASGHAPTDETYQTLIPLVSFLKTFLTQPYLRGIRNMTYIEQIQNHMPHIQPPFPDSPRLVAEKIGIIKENLAGIMSELSAPNPFGGGPQRGAGPAIPQPPGAGSKIRARDGQGNLHEAPAGTPLPAGWKAE